MVWSLLFEQMGIARGIANLASCMYVTLCKTTSDVDIIHTYRYRFWGALSLHSVLCIFQTPEKSPYISTIPEFCLYLICRFWRDCNAEMRTTNEVLDTHPILTASPMCEALQ